MHRSRLDISLPSSSGSGTNAAGPPPFLSKRAIDENLRLSRLPDDMRRARRLAPLPVLGFGAGSSRGVDSTGHGVGQPKRWASANAAPAATLPMSAVCIAPRSGGCPTTLFLIQPKTNSATIVIPAETKSARRESARAM